MSREVIRDQRAYDKAMKRREEYARRLLSTVQNRICTQISGGGKWKWIAANSWDHLTYQLSGDQSVMRGLSPKSAGIKSGFELVKVAIGILIQSGRVDIYEDTNGVIIALPNEWPPDTLQIEHLTIKHFDKIPDSDPHLAVLLANARCKPAIRKLIFSDH